MLHLNYIVSNHGTDTAVISLTANAVLGCAPLFVPQVPGLSEIFKIHLLFRIALYFTFSSMFSTSPTSYLYYNIVSRGKTVFVHESQKVVLGY